MYEELDRLLEGMDIPELRRRDTAWLLRNLHVRNGTHPDYVAARDEVVRLHRALMRADL